MVSRSGVFDKVILRLGAGLLVVSQVAGRQAIRVSAEGCNIGRLLENSLCGSLGVGGTPANVSGVAPRTEPPQLLIQQIGAWWLTCIGVLTTHKSVPYSFINPDRISWCWLDVIVA